MEGNILTEVFLPLTLAVIMLGMGLSLTVTDFKRIFIYPKAVTLGLINQLVILPLIAFSLAIFFDLNPGLAVGLMILAACPGGPTSNLISHLANGDTALSITLTAFSSLITVITIPFIVNFSISYFIPGGEQPPLNIFGTVISVLAITIIPVAIGMLIFKKSPQLARKMDRPFRIFSAVFFVVIILAAILKERENIVDYFSQIGPVALGLNVLTLAFGFFSAKALGLVAKQARTISIESGIQNGTLGITIAATLIGNSEMTIPSAVYSLIMFGTAGVLIFIGGNKKATTTTG
ncbi:MAG: bile acid:sodium symporter family protein [Cyclobacteriaceae bacterium]|uniref:Bile acid:sodium symporter family protein n=1 Tax=Algoriphagus marincola TaxID=264027 RepID=A0ABS7N850_9BACT|nr:bile acid:sodium symporter family protein [Algoriphagus marincola]MBY5952502.1 bile acid:sodium symporter family protein [Algoriphagus marincola]MCR9083742.1 bile acid:sodium symporter family protein [Cyclobacteriaceae bacterium]